MPEKPILFNTEMVKAFLEGRKTVTRRLIKPQPGTDAKMVYTYAAGRKQDCDKWRDLQTGQQWNPPYHAGDILYVRETWRVKDCNGDYANGTKTACIEFKAGADTVVMHPCSTDFDKWRTGARWHPSLHMPKDAARIWLKVTAVRVERLQNITNADAVREGIARLFDHMTDSEYADFAARTAPGRLKTDWRWNNYLWHGNFGYCGTGSHLSDAWTYQKSGYDSPRDSFSSLWNLTVDLKDWPAYGWDANPFVWVIEFEQITKEDALRRSADELR